MIKKIIIPFILFLVLNSCGYSPIYSTKYQDFKIDNISFKGERKINEILRKSLVSYTKITSAENVYDVKINSDKAVIRFTKKHIEPNRISCEREI